MTIQSLNIIPSYHLCLPLHSFSLAEVDENERQKDKRTVGRVIHKLYWTDPSQ